jgi:hypothetical protein
MGENIFTNITLTPGMFKKDHSTDIKAAAYFPSVFIPPKA